MSPEDDRDRDVDGGRRVGDGLPDVEPRPVVHATVLGTGLFLVLTILVEIGWSPLWRLDTAVASALNSFAWPHSWFVDLFALVSLVIHPMVIRIAAGVAVVALWWLGRRAGPGGRVGRADRHSIARLGVYVLVTVGGGGLLTAGMKELIGRTRPLVDNPVAHAHGLSYPSGHALGAVVGAMVLLVGTWVLVGRAPSARLVVPMVAVAALTGFSRLALGVHYLSDVLGGYLLGFAWAVTTTLLILPMRRTPVRRPSSRRESSERESAQRGSAGPESPGRGSSGREPSERGRHGPPDPVPDQR